jgi:hypothetical protein
MPTPYPVNITFGETRDVLIHALADDRVSNSERPRSPGVIGAAQDWKSVTVAPVTRPI